MDGLSAERYVVIYREILETLMLSVKRAGMYALEAKDARTWRNIILRMLRSAILPFAFSADYYLLGKSDSVELAVHLHWELPLEKAAHTELAGYREQMNTRKDPEILDERTFFLVLNPMKKKEKDGLKKKSQLPTNTRLFNIYRSICWRITIYAFFRWFKFLYIFWYNYVSFSIAIASRAIQFAWITA